MLRGDRREAAERAVNRRVTDNTYAHRFPQAQAARVGHPNPKPRRSARSVELGAGIN